MKRSKKEQKKKTKQLGAGSRSTARRPFVPRPAEATSQELVTTVG